MRVLFVGGGTGGHLTPALGLAEALEEQGHETLFLLGGRAVEQDYVGHDRRTASLGFDTSRLPRPLALLGAMARARGHARRFRPQLTIAVGGAASAAALAVPYAPLVLLEGNFVVGKSVRWMQRFAIATLTMYAETATKVVRGCQVGPIARQALQGSSQAEARLALGLDPLKPVLLSLGGSQGSQDVNEAAYSLLPELHQRGWQLLALCGPGKRSLFAQEQADVLALEHCEGMGLAYAAADFVLSRGGASTVGELWLQQLPALILPYPHHKDRQQEWNARALAPGLLCHRSFDQQARLELLACLDDPQRRAQMKQALVAAGPADGRAKAVAMVEEIGRPRA